jgi:hypothetical protein
VIGPLAEAVQAVQAALLSLPLRSAGHLDGQAGTGGAHVACCMVHVTFA